MSDRAVALTVAGSDSGGGAGVQADLKTMEALGVFGTSAVTSVTAQNTRGVAGVEDVPADVVAAQIDAVASDFDVGAAKTGMLSNAGIVRRVVEAVEEYDFPLVVDPVMVAQSGDRLLRGEAETALREELVPRATLVTPNLPEAEMLTDVAIDDRASMERAAREITRAGPDAALVTGGHLDGDPVDVLVADETRTFETGRVDTDATHGSGCTLSSAITAGLATGASIPEAVDRAEVLLDRAIRYGLSVGEGYGPVHHLSGIRNDAARFEALRAVREAVGAFERADVSRLVPEVGLNFAVATPYALDPDEVAAIEGRMTRTTDGVEANAGAWFGASSHVARFLLAVRDYDPAVTAACNLRLDEAIESEAAARWDVVGIDRREEPAEIADTEGGTMGWMAARVMDGRDGGSAPDAVIDGGDVGKEPMLRLLATSAADARERVLALDRRLDGGR